jgi:hypothetical protein
MSDCPFVAVIGTDHYPCQSHDGAIPAHHFAMHWPPCEAPFCRLPPGHGVMHSIPAGEAKIYGVSRLRCLSPGGARAVASEADRPGEDHRALTEGSVVLLTFTDKRFPLDVASWALENGHAGEDAASAVIRGLR